MSANRRSFVRELLTLMRTVEQEFSGQIKIFSTEEMNVNEVLVEITPSKGYYAHAAFVFRIQATPKYPAQKPAVFCLTSIFHPNISQEYRDRNVCMNLLYFWCPRYGLKDLLHAVLFLFYEPNFENPMTENAGKPEEGLTMEETVRKSFHGGMINGVRYEPNMAWLRWTKENESEFAKYSSRTDCFESLSPFSPMVNRALTIPDRSKKTVTWYGLDWYSVSDAFRPIHNHQSITPRNHFHIPILPFSVFYLHNWLSYMSRVELYGSSLGYSRPLNAGTLSSMGSTCLSPASLGCGQCCYADGWPLWLLWRVSRVLCRLMAFCCVKPIRLSDGSDLGTVDTDVSFPFSDLDEI